MDYLVYSLNSSSRSSSSSSHIIADGLAVDESVIITSGSASGSETITRGATVEIGRGGVVDDPGGILAAANSCFSENLSSSSSAGEVFQQQQQQHADYLNELFREKFNDATVIVSVVVLVLINFVVIAGNILVILSVFTSAKLRTVTNFFIGKGELLAGLKSLYKT